MKYIRILVLVTLIVMMAASNSPAQNVNVGQVAPTFLLNQFLGGTVSNSDFSGKILFLNFLGSY